MSRRISRQTGRRQFVSGASLIELMISIAIGLMILVALLTLLSNTSQARAELERTSENLENGRYAVELLSEDLQLAGYYGEQNPQGTPAFPLPDPCSLDPAVWEAAMPVHAQGFNDTSGVPSCIPGTRLTGTDVLTLRRTHTCIAGVGDCDPVVAGAPYFQVSLCAAPGQKFAIGAAGVQSFSLTEKDCATTAGLRRYAVHTYFVSSENGAGRAVPTLKRLEFAGGALRETALVEGIERMQLEYGIDTDADGSADVFTADPAGFTVSGCGTCTAATNMENIVAVKLHFLVRALDPSPGYIDRKVYNLGRSAAGALASVGPLNDAFRRRVYTSVVRLMNPSSRREKP